MLFPEILIPVPLAVTCLPTSLCDTVNKYFSVLEEKGTLAKQKSTL